MKNKDLIEYYPNSIIKKHEIIYFDNGCKGAESFFDKNGLFHRENELPDYQQWYENGMLGRKTYAFHGRYHNTTNPADIWILSNGKIHNKYYHLKYRFINYTKLNWQNNIKNI